jgi:hypothetical protein
LLPVAAGPAEKEITISRRVYLRVPEKKQKGGDVSESVYPKHTINQVSGHTLTRS